jgi:carboxylesterase
MTRLMSGAEPYFFPGDETGCLLIHGFTGTPDDLRGLGENLAGKGFTVHSPRLAGHATHPSDLARTQYRDWLANAEDGYHLLRPICKRIIVIGYSAGGDLAVLLASQQPMDGLVLLSTPYQLPRDPRLALIRPLSLIVRKLAKRTSDWQSSRIPEPRRYYEYYPTPAVAELKDLLQVVHKTLPKVSVPSLLIQSRQDGSRGIGETAMPALHDHLGSEDKTMIWIDGSGHAITRDAKHQEVFGHITEFINRVRAEERAEGTHAA